MKEGAFAMIDCLGFKGIWKKADPGLLIKKLLTLEQIVPSHITSEELLFERMSFGPVRANVRLLSDTVAISLQYEDQADKSPSEAAKNYLVSTICLSLIKVLDLFVKDDPALVLRGCISYGEHLSESNFMVGPAVDETAEHMDLADGAFVWLHPTAAGRYRDMQDRTSELLSNVPASLLIEVLSYPMFRDKLPLIQEWTAKYGEEDVANKFLNIVRPIATAPLLIDPYNMPLKSGAHLKCAVLNPLAFQRSAEMRCETIKRYSDVISGNRMDIWLKRQNTMEMLEVADKLTSDFDKEIARMESPGSTSNS